MNKNSNAFEYRYSAEDQKEIQRIRQKYVPRQESKLDTLRRMDRDVIRKANQYALSLGILGLLILGFGMSLFMSSLGVSLGLSEPWSLLLGVFAGLVGMVLAALAYPVHRFVIKKERERIAPEVIRLTDELMK